MGVIYSVACKQCKVTRDLDKFYRHQTIETKTEAVEYTHRMSAEGDKGYRAALLVSFLSEHRGHNCVFFSENDDCAAELDPDEGEYSEDTDFFNT